MALDRYVFVWRDDDRKLAFVFWGDKLEPQIRWVERVGYESELNDYLNTLDRQPALAKGSLRFSVAANIAKASARHVERQLRKEGFTLLSPRDRATIDGGFKTERPIFVQTSWGRNWFPSVRAAARAMGLDPSAVTLAAQNPKRDDIRYADQVDQL